MNEELPPPFPNVPQSDGPGCWKIFAWIALGLILALGLLILILAMTCGPMDFR